MHLHIKGKEPHTGLLDSNKRRKVSSENGEQGYVAAPPVPLKNKTKLWKSPADCCSNSHLNGSQASTLSLETLPAPSTSSVAG